MGVPKFYRWISERYPCLSEVVREYQIPEFDNLYLDMNGIIHNCSHPNDEDVHFRISEEQIFHDIFRYIEFLFRMIKPRKVFFMAIDGVAPRAKMNQQRGRRFRAAKEAETREQEAKERGEKLPDEKRFDSNCITPGTEFMDRLHQHLKYFVTNKVSNDELWRDVRVILSGHETPGEGEHKIMDFIRFEKSQPNYDSNTRHCLYGLDADLIMLGMCSHEPHFSLLREEVKYIRSKTEKNKRDSNPEAITFHLLHLSLFREYIDHEFSELKTTLSFGYNLENVIDDWVLMGFLVGNDFIPHIPHFHINKSSLLKLYSVYKKVLPTLDGYLNEDGKLNLFRFQKYINELKAIDIDNFNDTYADMKYFQSKTGRKLFNRKLEDTSEFFNTGAASAPMDCLLEPSMGKSVDVINVDNSDDDSNEYESDDIYESSDSENLFLEEFRTHKRDYYINKLKYKEVDDSVLKEQAFEYIRAIQWNLHYYYDGCMSWGWFYPHHYAPYISDVNNFEDIDLHFEMGEPFKPYEQLLAVLPAASKELLPKAYECLVTNQTSNLIDFYPTDFETDMNEKQQAWEAVVLIPFIDEKLLLREVKALEHNLSANEKRRNKHGPHLMFTFSEQPLNPFPSPSSRMFPDIAINHAKCSEYNLNAFRIPIEGIHKGLCTGIKLDEFIPGFPTLRHIPHDVVVRKERVRVFESASMGENTILIIKNETNYDVSQVAKDYLNKTVFVNWPHLLEAKVFSVSDAEQKYYLKDNRLICEPLEDKEYTETSIRVKAIVQKYKDRWGVIVGRPDIVLHVSPMTGRKYVSGMDGSLKLEKQWSTMPMLCPIQTVVKDIPSHDQHIQQFKSLKDIYPKGAKCFPIDGPYYGSMAQVIQYDSSDGYIKIEVFPQLEPDLREIQDRAKEIVNEKYFTNYVLSQRLGLSPHLVSRMTGTIFVRPSSNDQRKVNIGLNLKFNAKNEEIPGFSIKRDETWLFSDKVFKIMEQYLTKFPFIFERLSGCVEKDYFSINDLIPGDNQLKTLDEIQNWLRSQPSAGERRQKCNAEILDENVVKAIEDVINTHIVLPPKEMPRVELIYKPNQLFRPIHYLGFSLPDPKAKYNLFDRVVNIRNGISVPLGAKGTIIGKHLDDTKEVNSLYDVVFDEVFSGGLNLRCTKGKGYKLSPANLLNITYGLKMTGKYEQYLYVGQPLQSRPHHNNYSYRQNSQNYGRNQNDFTFGQRFPRPRLQNMPPFFNASQANPQTAISIRTLNHSKTSPFQSPKHEMQNREEFPPMEQMWNVLCGMSNDKTLPKGTFANIAAAKRPPENPNLSAPATDKNKSNSKVRNQKTVQENKRSEGNGQNRGNPKLHESYRQILLKASEQYFRLSPKFDITMTGPMKAKTIKLLLPDNQSFHTYITAHKTEWEAYEFLCGQALDYINRKFGANIDLNRPTKLLSSPSFIVPNQSSPNRPKISASDLPRPPTEWVHKNDRQSAHRSAINPEIPESFVEHNEQILRQLEKEKRSSSLKANINTSANKDRNLQPKRLFDHRNDNIVNSIQNPIQNPKQNQNTQRFQRKVPNDSINDIPNSFQRPRSHRSSGSGQSAFDHQFVPLQVARNNQSQRQTPHKNSPQKPKNLNERLSNSSDDIEILTPVELSNRSATSRDNDIEILTPDSLTANSSSNSSNRRRSRRGARLVVNLD